MKKVQMSVKDVCEKLEIKEGTFRFWMTKVKEGEVYYKSNINYYEIQKGVRERFDNNDELIKTKLGCGIEDLEIIKKVRNSYDKLGVDDLEENTKYEIRNYSLVYFVEVKKIELIDGVKLFIMECSKRGWVIYSEKDLEKDNIKIIEIL